MNKGKYFAITTILLLILCLTVAYTSYSATISTNGTSSITNDWNLFFKKVESIFNENSNSNPNQPSITNNRQTIKLYPEINTPNSEIIYNIKFIKLCCWKASEIIYNMPLVPWPDSL